MGGNSRADRFRNRAGPHHPPQRDFAGQQSQDAFSASVVLLKDERPFIRITEPREVSFATPDVLLPVTLAAEDDYGIARVQLFRALNRNLSSELLALAGSLDKLAQEAEQLANQPGLKNGAVAIRLANLGRRLAGGRKQLENNALAPIEHLARIYPLFEDQARFVQLYLRQRDLAERLASLKGHDGEESPALGW